MKWNRSEKDLWKILSKKHKLLVSEPGKYKIQVVPSMDPTQSLEIKILFITYEYSIKRKVNK